MRGAGTSRWEREEGKEAADVAPRLQWHNRKFLLGTIGGGQRAKTSRDELPASVACNIRRNNVRRLCHSKKAKACDLHRYAAAAAGVTAVPSNAFSKQVGFTIRGFAIPSSLASGSCFSAAAECRPFSCSSLPGGQALGHWQDPQATSR